MQSDLAHFSCSPSTESLATNMNAASAAVGALMKNREVSHSKFSYTYIDLNSLLAELKPIWANHNINFLALPCGENGLIVRITCTETGQFIQTYTTSTVSVKTLQDQGGFITYMTRYSILNAFNIEAHDDTDGITSVNKPKKENLLPRTPLFNEIKEKLKKGETTIETLQEQYILAPAVLTILRTAVPK